MVMTKSLHFIGQKVVSGELRGGVILFTLDGNLSLTADEADELRAFLNEKHERESADV